MIIVIGKEDRAKMLDAQAYVHQYGKLMLKEQWTNPDSAKLIDEDCQNIANRILKALGKNFVTNNGNTRTKTAYQRVCI